MAEPRKRKPREVMAIGPEATEGLQLTFGLAIKFKACGDPTKDNERGAYLVAAIDKLLLEDPKLEGFEICEHGEESAVALASAATGQLEIARAIAAHKARRN